MADNKKQDKLKKRIIFYIALLSVYFILTAMAAFIFEYYIITVTDGKIIFSLSMNWQVILFAAELVTIAVQGIMLALSINAPSYKKYMAIRISGTAAGVLAFAAVIYLLFSDGFTAYPALVFTIYMVIIVSVRTFMIPNLAFRLLKISKGEKKRSKP